MTSPEARSGPTVTNTLIESQGTLSFFEAVSLSAKLLKLGDSHESLNSNLACVTRCDNVLLCLMRMGFCDTMKVRHNPARQGILA